LIAAEPSSAFSTESAFSLASKTALTALTLAAASHSRSHRLESCRQFLLIERAVPVRVVLFDQHCGKLGRFRSTAFTLSTAAFTLSTAAFALSLANPILGQYDRGHGRNRGSRGASGEQFAEKAAAVFVNLLKRQIYGLRKLVCHHRLLKRVKQKQNGIRISRDSQCQVNEPGPNPAFTRNRRIEPAAFPMTPTAAI